MTFDLDEARTRVSGLDRARAAELRADVESLARPRMSGTEGAAEVEQLVRDRFEALGYETEPLPFQFSAWPGRFGLPAAGVVLLLSGVLAGWLIAGSEPALALTVLVLALAIAVLPLLVLGSAIRGMPWARIDSANLLFRKPGSRPAWIVMAHRDSKSQLAPTALRTAALITAGVAWLALVVLAGMWIAGDAYRLPGTAMTAGVILSVCGLVLALSWASNASPGALDNASGVAALLATAGRVGSGGDVAFLITDGEELGLAGARDVARRLPPVQGVINVEGLDDGGTFIVAEGHGWRRRGSAPQLAAALLTAGRALDLPVHRRKLPLSLLVDHLPVARAGIPSLTLLRGSWKSLMRVHRPGDDLSRLGCDGAADGATLLAAALHLLREDRSSHLASPGRGGS
ncbi:MAG: Zn-dependent exopeptidase M28 [Gemmatimonadetes bacterium]|nr:Zn-dependent exopeptidase M28 [Gemmatimonadota bacterium]